MKRSRPIRRSRSEPPAGAFPTSRPMPTPTRALRCMTRITARAPRHGSRWGAQACRLRPGQGLIAIADAAGSPRGMRRLNGESETLPAIYSIPSGDFHDITTGGNGGFERRAGL